MTDPKASDPEEDPKVKVVDMPSMICQKAIDPQQEVVVVVVKVVDMPSMIWQEAIDPQQEVVVAVKVKARALHWHGMVEMDETLRNQKARQIPMYPFHQDGAAGAHPHHKDIFARKVSGTSSIRK